ncbi:MAG: GHKL domain-containing protein [Lachnospiraceae bacterium]|nr:GHKL domain-containing protein [Lachnospiraceae bacterium]
MIDIIYGIVYTTVYVILCKVFMETFMQKRAMLSRGYSFLLLAVLVGGDFLLSVLLADNILMKMIIIILFTSVIMWCYFEQRLLLISICVFVFQGLALVVDYISMLAIRKILEMMQEGQLETPVISMFMGILSQMVLFFIVLQIRRYFSKNSGGMLTEMGWTRFIVLPVFTIISITAMLANFDMADISEQQKSVLLCIALGILAMNIFVFYLIYDIIEREVQITENKMILERVKNETGMYQQIWENYDLQRKREHEYKSQLSVIATLAQKREFDELNHYLEKFSDEIAHRMDAIDTNNVIVNAILNTKWWEARQKGITFVFKVNDLSNLRIGEEDIVIILSNLLNNAIEACEKCENKTLKLKFIKEKEDVIISVINTYGEKPIMSGGKYKTNKKDALRHGFGIRNVKETVEKYGGTCVFKHDEQLFQCSILISE